MTRKVFAAAIIATALAGFPGVSQAAPIAPAQSAAGKADVTPVYYRGHYYHHYYRAHHYYRRYGYYGGRPYYGGRYYGSYAYEPEGSYESYSNQPDEYYYSTYCPYYGHQNLWWCH